MASGGWSRSATGWSSVGMVATDYRSMCSTLSRPLERGCTASCDRIGSIDDPYRTIMVIATYTFGRVPDD